MKVFIASAANLDLDEKYMNHLLTLKTNNEIDLDW